MNFKLHYILAAFLLLNVACKKTHKEIAQHDDDATYIEIPTPIHFSPDIPVDVNPELQKSLKKENNIFELNQEFNKYSWEAFLAINWPTDDQGNPKKYFYDKGIPAWQQWKEAFQVYRKNGETPTPWGSTPSLPDQNYPKNVTNTQRVIVRNTTPTHPATVADEVDQAFAGKLFDQWGNVVVYEALMNKPEFDYIVENELYNINGQIAYYQKNKDTDNGNINFPKGDYASNTLGAIEIKFAWRVFPKNYPHKDRYYIEEGYVQDKDGNWKLTELGMIGFHISQKTPTGKQWVWSTFEHIDNLDQNIITKEVTKDGKKATEVTVIHPTLTDPNCEICPVNVDVSNNNTTYTHHKGEHGNYWTISGDLTDKYFTNTDVMKTQAKRMVDIPVRVQQLNAQMQAYFKKYNSVWQYYQLIDTQYPLHQNVKPASNKEASYHLPQSVHNKSGGQPNIALLTNITMETFFQDGNQNASNLMEANPESDLTIFGTESCIGCHSSASAYQKYSFDPNSKNYKLISGDQLSGDFSWLLGRASWKDNKPETNLN